MRKFTIYNLRSLDRKLCLQFTILIAILLSLVVFVLPAKVEAADGGCPTYWNQVGTWDVGCNNNLSLNVPATMMKMTMVGGGGDDGHISYYCCSSGGSRWYTSDGIWNAVTDQSGALDVGNNRYTNNFGSSKPVTNQYISVGCNDGETMRAAVYACAPQAPTPVIYKNASCIPSPNKGDEYTVSWGTPYPQVTWVDISLQSNFVNYYNKNVTGSASTSAPSGFSNSLSLAPNTTYYVRLWNGYVHSNTASFTTPAACPPSNPNPYGYLDAADCDSFRGWACDESNYNQAIDIHFYANNPAGSGTFVGAVNANQFRQDLVNAGVCGRNGSHGFTFTTPDSLKDGNNHSIYAYGINIPSGPNPQLSNSPKTINCAPPVPPPPPPTGLTATCFDTSGTLSWTPAAGATSYMVRIDDGDGSNNSANAVGATDNCGSSIPHDICVNGWSSSSMNISTTAGKTYRWWVHACNSAGCSTYTSGTNFTCEQPIPSPTHGPASATSCGKGLTRATGLVSTLTAAADNKFNSVGACIVDPKTYFVEQKIPTYEGLKSRYFTQVKESSIVKKVVHNGDTGEGGLSTYLQQGKNLIHMNGNLGMNGNLTGTNTAVVFIEGYLHMTDSNFTYGNNTSGLVFVVRDNVYINKNVTRFDGVIIAGGTIYTGTNAGSTCTPSSVEASALEINGSLINLTPNKPVKFCRTLRNNTRPAEAINQQAKYLVILRNLFSDTTQRWSEIAP